MSVKLTNPSYSYSSGGTISVSVTVDVMAPDGITVLYSTGISANAHLGGNWKAELQASLVKQATSIAQEYSRAMGAVIGAYPTATSPAGALTQFVAEVQAALVGV